MRSPRLRRAAWFCSAAYPQSHQGPIRSQLTFCPLLCSLYCRAGAVAVPLPRRPDRAELLGRQDAHSPGAGACGCPVRQPMSSLECSAMPMSMPPPLAGAATARRHRLAAAAVHPVTAPACNGNVHSRLPPCLWVPCWCAGATGRGWLRARGGSGGVRAWLAMGLMWNMGADLACCWCSEGRRRDGRHGCGQPVAAAAASHVHLRPHA